MPRESYGLPLGALAEGAVPETPYSGDGFDDEMLLIVNCPALCWICSSRRSAARSSPPSG